MLSSSTGSNASSMGIIKLLKMARTMTNRSQFSFALFLWDIMYFSGMLHFPFCYLRLVFASTKLLAILSFNFLLMYLSENSSSKNCVDSECSWIDYPRFTTYIFALTLLISSLQWSCSMILFYRSPFTFDSNYTNCFKLSVWLKYFNVLYFIAGFIFLSRSDVMIKLL